MAKSAGSPDEGTQAIRLEAAERFDLFHDAIQDPVNQHSSAFTVPSTKRKMPRNVA